MSFRFLGSDNTTVFRCNLKCLQCAGTKKDGQRCSRTTCKALPYCAQHLKAMGLEIRPSTIADAGLGLFTLIDRKRFEDVCVYDGEHITVEELQQRYGDDTAPYALEINPGLVYDAACKRYTAAFANQIVRPAKPNVKFHLLADNISVTLRTTKAVKAGSELFADYGRNYWEGAFGQSETKKYKIKSLAQ
jgi:hypothetical protein